MLWLQPPCAALRLLAMLHEGQQRADAYLGRLGGVSGERRAGLGLGLFLFFGSKKKRTPGGEFAWKRVS